MQLLLTNLDAEAFCLLTKLLNAYTITGPYFPPVWISRSRQLSDWIGPEIPEGGSSDLSDAVDQRLASTSTFRGHFGWIEVVGQFPLKHGELSFWHEHCRGSASTFERTECQQLYASSTVFKALEWEIRIDFHIEAQDQARDLVELPSLALGQNLGLLFKNP